MPVYAGTIRVAVVWLWEDNIKEVRRGCGDWMELAQDGDSWRALVSTVMNFRVVL